MYKNKYFNQKQIKNLNKIEWLSIHEECLINKNIGDKKIKKKRIENQLEKLQHCKGFKR